MGLQDDFILHILKTIRKSIVSGSVMNKSLPNNNHHTHISQFLSFYQIPCLIAIYSNLAMVFNEVLDS